MEIPVIDSLEPEGTPAKAQPEHDASFNQGVANKRAEWKSQEEAMAYRTQGRP